MIAIIVEVACPISSPNPLGVCPAESIVHQLLIGHQWVVVSCQLSILSRIGPVIFHERGTGIDCVSHFNIGQTDVIEQFGWMTQPALFEECDCLV